MDISIFGTGYVGLVTGACLSEVGHNVSCIDIDQQKIDQLNNGNITIYEPNLEEIVSNNIKLGRLKFFNSPEEPLKNSDVIMIAVGTPSDEDGSTDVKYISEVAKTIGQLIDNYKIIVTKSTVPVGIGIGSDTRIGHSFIYPGIGYGGSCFPKDIKALLSTAKDAGYESKILKAVEDVNNAQKRVIVDKIEECYAVFVKT